MCTQALPAQASYRVIAFSSIYSDAVDSLMSFLSTQCNAMHWTDIRLVECVFVRVCLRTFVHDSNHNFCPVFVRFDEVHQVS